MNKSKPIIPREQERQIIDQINASDYTNVSEHVRRSLHFYAANNFPALVAFKSSK